MDRPPADFVTRPAPGDAWTGREAADVADISYRQLDYWARTGLLVPSIAPARGSGSRRLYSDHDVRLLRVVGALRLLGLNRDDCVAVTAELADPGDLTGWDRILYIDGRTVAWEPHGDAGVYLDLSRFRDLPSIEEVRAA